MKKNRLICFAGAIVCSLAMMSQLSASSKGRKNRMDTIRFVDPTTYSVVTVDMREKPVEHITTSFRDGFDDLFEEANRNSDSHGGNGNFETNFGNPLVYDDDFFDSVSGQNGEMPPLNLHHHSTRENDYEPLPNSNNLGEFPADEEWFFNPHFSDLTESNQNQRNTNPEEFQNQNVQEQDQQYNEEEDDDEYRPDERHRYHTKTKTDTIWAVDFSNPIVRANRVYWITCFFTQVLEYKGIEQISNGGEGKNWANHIIKCLNDPAVLDRLANWPGAIELFGRIVGTGGDLQSNINEARRMAQEELAK